jgi:hypothetical protein
MGRTFLAAAACIACSLFVHAAHAQPAEPAAQVAPAAEPAAAASAAPAAPAAAPASVAASASDEAAPAEPAAVPAVSRKGFNILATLGYGKSTDEVYGLQLEPYAFSVGLDFGYTWAMGFRLGGYASYSPGRDVSQAVTPLGGTELDVTIATQSVSGGLSIGFDVPLYFLILRHTVNLGVTWMDWDFGERPWPELGLSTESSSTIGFNVVPGLTVLWPLGMFECGIGFDYFVQTNFKLPNAAVGKLVIGVKL